MSSVYDAAIKTPLEKAQKLSVQNGCQVYLKREDLQPVHSFKIRGAYNKISSLTEAEKAKGVICASAGNHAQGVALSAQKLGISALIVMPRTTPQIKVDAVIGYGGQVVLQGDNYTEAFDHCQSLIAESGRVFIHPFDDPLVIEGQGTIGQEILDQNPDVTHIFVCTGGGGMLAGISKYVKNIRPEVKIISVEPTDSNAMQASIQANKRVMLDHVGIFADGVAVKQVGENTFNICKQYVDDFITVNIDQMCASIKSIFEDTRSIVEPAGALGVAGVCNYNLPKNAVAVAICSGANMSFERLQFIAERTLLGSGREAIFAVTLPEKPGALQAFCTDIVNGNNITEFNYRLNKRDAAHIFVGINISSAQDKAKIIQKMDTNGYKYVDLSDDEIAKEHIRHMIGGPSPEAKNEQIYSVNFPERPGALSDFLLSITEMNCNISLFHYRGQGADQGQVLIGFENPHERLTDKLRSKTNYTIEPSDSFAIELFINKTA